VDTDYPIWQTSDVWAECSKPIEMSTGGYTRRTDGRWQVTAFHNTRVRPLATSGPMVELGGRFVHWRTNRARRKLR
jgi:hypothetical protein